MIGNKMELKKCCCCKAEFPKTLEFFHKQIIKEIRVDGRIAIYNSFRHVCRACYKNKSKDTSKKRYWINPELSREVNNKKRRKNIDAHRKCVANYRLRFPEKMKAADDKRTLELPDSKIANMLGLPTKDIPKDIIEMKRLTIKLQRELKLITKK
jgi:hypothetical protein